MASIDQVLATQARQRNDKRDRAAFNRWRNLYNARHQPGANQAKLGPREHGAFAESFVREHPLLGPPAMLAAIPAYNAAKGLGLIDGWFGPSVDSLAESYRGVGRGVAANLRGLADAPPTTGHPLTDYLTGLGTPAAQRALGDPTQTPALNLAEVERIRRSRRPGTEEYYEAAVARAGGGDPSLQMLHEEKTGRGFQTDEGRAAEGFMAALDMAGGGFGSQLAGLVSPPGAGALGATGALRAKGNTQVPRTSGALREYGLEPDMVRATMNDPRFKGKKTIPSEVLDEAIATRAQLRAEPFPEGRSKPYSEMTDEELVEFGKLYDVDLSRTPTERFTFDDVTIDVPGGLDRGKPFTYTDMMVLKGQGIDASKLPEDFQTSLQRKLLDATTPRPEDLADPTYMANRLLFGMQSPNMPLLRNQGLQARMKVRDADELAALAEATPWQIFADRPSIGARRDFDEAYSRQLGLGGASTGGLALRGTPSFADMSDFAKLYRDNPEWFTKPENLDWIQQMERTQQVPGLSPKTASFGQVWQDPGAATISAVDRHMAREGADALLSDPVLGPPYKERVLALWNKNKPDAQVASFEDIAAQPGGQSFLDDAIFSTVSSHNAAKTRMASGEYNPKVPDYLRGGPVEPAQTTIMGDPYRFMLNRIGESGEAQGLNLFGEQWRVWDRIRERLEPHESMHRDFQRLPRSPGGELLDAMNVQAASGYASAGGKVRPFDWRKGMYGGVSPDLLIGLGAGGLGALGAGYFLGER